MNTEILRIIEGGLTNDRRKIVCYSNRLADRLDKEGEAALAECIREKLATSSSSVVADAVRTIPIDADSRLQIVEIVPSTEKRQDIVLGNHVGSQIDEFINLVNHQSELELAGVEIKKSLLLYGKPGCGKTSIAHYISEKTGLPLVVARLDGVVSSLLGSTAKNLRKIFEYAVSMPCILFLDEFDAIAKARNDSHELGELKRVINSLLQNIDSMPAASVLIAATNHPEMLDPAVWRRFVQIVEVGLPSGDDIMELIKVFSKGFQTEFSEDKNRVNYFVEAVNGLSPSDIKNIFDRAKAKSVMSGEKKISFSSLLAGVFELKSEDCSEETYIKFLRQYGLTQAEINKATGVSLRKIKELCSTKL